MFKNTHSFCLLPKSQSQGAGAQKPYSEQSDDQPSLGATNLLQPHNPSEEFSLILVRISVMQGTETQGSFSKGVAIVQR